MSTLPPNANRALDPVREALREAANKQAAELRDDARRQVEDIVASARAQAAQTVAEAVAAGEKAARTAAALRSSRIRREAHELVLEARSSVLAELRRQLRSRSLELQGDSRYPALLESLANQCLSLLGPGAKVSTSPDGGVTAEAGSRRLDLSLPVLAELTLESLPRERELWAG